MQPNWPLLMAAAVVVMLPVIVVYLFAQRYFVEGITLSGMKGWEVLQNDDHATQRLR